jgi:hypothetical protein
MKGVRERDDEARLVIIYLGSSSEFGSSRHLNWKGKGYWSVQPGSFELVNMAPSEL